jgi:hypothetical protein
MTAAVTYVVLRGQTMGFSRADRVEDLRNRPGGRHEHVDSRLAQSGCRSSADSLADDGPDGVCTEQPDVMAGAVVVVAFRISHDLEVGASAVRQEEEGCVTEVLGGHRFEPAVIVRRYTDLHGGLLAR